MNARGVWATIAGLLLGMTIATAALAQEQVAQAAPAASEAKPAATHGTRGSHRRHTRRQGRTAAHRARASAHHKAAMPAEAPKS